MPKRNDYETLTLADAVRTFAEHHAAVKNRHISRDEYELLIRAAEALERETPKLGAFS